MSKNREKLIRDALDAAKAKGIKIWPGAVFDWTDKPFHLKEEKFRVPGPSGDLPSACSAIGALELVLGRSAPGEKGYTKKVCDYLDVGGYWLYRFHLGFDRGRQLTYKVKVDKKLVEKQCEVSRLGIRLRKKYVGW